MEHENQHPKGTDAGEAEEVIIEIVDLEDHAKQHGTPAPRARQYAFRVDKTRVVVDKPIITGAEILAKVDKTPDVFKLYQHKRGHQPILIEPDKKVDLREQGVERFTTMPRDTTEGLDSSPSKREFRLPETDEAYLNGLGLPWETIKETTKDSTIQWLIIHDWAVPAGYNHDKVSLALLIPDNYSDSQIDMVYFNQPLARTDRRSIGALSNQAICGVQWQRWSRHRTSSNPWRPGVDDIASHLALVDEWLRRELTKG